MNDIVRQESSTSQMVFQIPALLAAASRLMTLERGDVLATGTPSGVWPIVPGDRLDAEIEGIGQLRCRVSARKR